MVQILQCLFAGFGLGIDAFLSVLPLYNALSGVKEQLLSWATGIPVIVFSIIFAIPSIFSVIKKLVH